MSSPINKGKKMTINTSTEQIHEAEITKTINKSETVKTNEKLKIDYKEPSRFKVVFLNDEQTPMDFVVMLLVELFKHSEETAHALTMKIHEEGSGVVGVYSYEIAEQRELEVISICRDNGFPLKVKLEEES
jgi:ATP-dependent Clp protease adaptor protein ClpS